MNPPTINPISAKKAYSLDDFAHSRANLSAFSQVHNLYFVASEDLVKVYRPSFPDQTLHLCILLRPPNVGHLSGFINEIKPHCINHLIVSFLGNREILLLACDDGDVCSWWTDHIEYVTAHISQNPSNSASYAEVAYNLVPAIEPWFKECVKKSAWGLAVHSEARKIAVTSNSHSVCVFEFALHEEVSEKGLDPSQLRRYRDKKIWLPDSGNNLPCVSFCNTGHDPTGRYLVSGDIDGRALLWDLETACLVEAWNAHYCIQPEDGTDCPCLNRNDHRFPHAVWGLYWIDLRSFPLKESLSDTPLTATHIDLSSQDPPPRSSKTWRLLEPEGSERHIFSSNNPTSGSVSNNILVHSPLDSPEEDSDYDDNEDDDEDDYLDPQILPNYVLSPSLEPLETEMPFVISRDRSAAQEDAYHALNIPPLPFLQISAEQIWLDPERCPSRTTCDTTFAMTYPLRQFIAQPHYHGRFFSNTYLMYSRVQNRMILHAFIPELGIFIVGAPVGRCAIISLYYNVAPDGRKVYGMSLDAVLPFEEQEWARERPAQLLMGLAVAPMQGDQNIQMVKDRTWRLLLHYEDHTILSYEIGRGVIGSRKQLDII
jgi:CRT10